MPTPATFRSAIWFCVAVTITSWSLNASAGPVPALIYGVDNNADIYEVDPVSQTTTLALGSAITSGTCNSLA